MNSKFLHFLFVLTCAALIGLGPLRAQGPGSTSDGNGSAVTAPAQHSDASHSAVSPSAAPDTSGRTDRQQSSDTAIANDRGTVAPNAGGSTRFSAGWIGLLGLLGLLGLVRRPKVERVERDGTLASQQRPEDIRRAA